MIAADTSVLIDYFKGLVNSETEKIHQALTYQALVLPPVVLTELLSDSSLPKPFIELLSELPLLEIETDFWVRAGHTRSILLKKKLKARLADTLIAQSCIDHKTPLITRDQDFKHFEKYCGLLLV